MIIGGDSSFAPPTEDDGKAKAPGRTQMGTLAAPDPMEILARKLEHSPSLGAASFDLYRTTATRSCIFPGSAAAELAMEKDRGLIGGKRSKRKSKGTRRWGKS